MVDDRPADCRLLRRSIAWADSDSNGTYIDVIRGHKIVEHWSEMSLPQFMQALSAE